jgi:hypothetical protein
MIVVIPDGSEIVYDYAACYSPSPDRPPFYVDLPVANPSGDMIQEVWDRWLAFDPVVNVHDRGRRVRISGFEEWTLGDDGLIAASLGHYDQAEYERQLEHGVELH